MKNGLISFEGKRCRVRCTDENAGQADVRLFEREWEVFVARYDRESNKYLTRTYCCEDAIGE